MIYQDKITKKDFLELSRNRELCVSIYLKTSNLLQDLPNDRLCFRHLVDHATEQASQIYDKKEVQLVEKQLVDLLNDDIFWIYQGKSLGVLVTKENLITYRLGYEVINIAKASDRFYLRPLLPAIHSISVLVLAISQKSVNLYKLIPTEKLVLVNLPEMPTSLEELTARPLQKNSVAEAKLRDDTGKKVLQLQFVRAIEKVIKPYVQAANLALIVATTEELFSLYKSINTYHKLSNEQIIGSVENISTQELTDLVKHIVLKLRNEVIVNWEKEFIEKSDTAKSSSDFATIVKLASQGQISKLLVDLNSVFYGQIDQFGDYKILEEKSVDSYDMIDEVVDRVMSSGGDVLAVRNDETVPDRLVPISASFRW
jgi:hypothetical protein